MKTELCTDCGIEEATTFYVLGAARCDECTDAFDMETAKREYLRGRPMRRIASEDCSHGDRDDFTCLECGKDLTEDLSAKAYDDWKASRYDD